VAPLRGRGAELTEVSALLATITDGAGRIVVMSGAAGVGKTRLLAEAGRMADERGFLVTAGAADELDRVTPWGPLLQALGPAILEDAELSSLRALLDQRLAAIELLGDAIERASADRPLLIMVDDLQWADQATLLALATLPVRLFSYPVGWLLAMRPVPATSWLDGLLARLADAGATMLRLAPLDPAAAGQLALDLTGDLTGDGPDLELVARAEGNPLYLTELLRGTAAPGVTLSSAVVAHLRALPPEASNLLKIASVLGRDFAVSELAALTGRPASALLAPLEQALRAELITERGTRLAFRHDVIREAAYDQLPAAARRALHADAAAALRVTGAPLSRIASQYSAGAQPGDEAAIGTLAAAAGELFATSPSEAADLALRVLALLGHGDPRRGEMTIAALRMLGWAGRLDDATTVGEAFLGSGAASGPATRAAVLAATRRAWRIYTMRPYPEPLPPGLIDDPGVPLTLRANLLALEQSATMWAGDLSGAHRALGTARGWAAQAGDDREVSTVLSLITHCDMLSGHMLDSLARDRAELAAAIDKGWQATAVACRYLLGQALTRLGRPADALTELQQALVAAGQTGYTQLIAPACQRQAECLFGQGRLDDARTALQAHEPAGVPFPAETEATQRALLAETLLRQGDLSGARQVAGAAPADPRFVPLYADLHWARALCLQAAGKPEEALAELDPVYQQFRSGLLIFASVRADRIPALVALAAAAGDMDRAGEAAHVAALIAERNPGQPLLAGLAAHAGGLAGGDPAALRDAVNLLETAEWPLATAAAREDLAARLAACDRRNDAIQELDKAYAGYVAAAAERDASRVRGALRGLGVRRRRVVVARPDHGWASLTPAELAVVEAVAEGRTNREAAAQLFLSPDTVNTHLRHAFGKLGIRSRVELARRYLTRDQEVT
jgi:DNA-binding CsgD family transcriptional regulator